MEHPPYCSNDLGCVLTLALIAAYVTTLEHVDIRLANEEAQPGKIGLAKPHAPLDRAPGEPVRN